MREIIIYTDGGARGNPGPAAAGVVFCNGKKKVIDEYSKFLGEEVTNNEAEYDAVIFALEKFKSRFGKELADKTEIEIRADSELLVKQLNGDYKVKSDNLQERFVKINNLTVDFKEVEFTHVTRNYNKDADKLVNEELDERE